MVEDCGFSQETVIALNHLTESLDKYVCLMAGIFLLSINFLIVLFLLNLPPSCHMPLHLKGNKYIFN